jgi:peptidoglycan glycosyltransferase
MNRAMRRIASVSFGVIAFIAVWLTLQAAIAGSTYSDDPRNQRAAADPTDSRRGIITTSDGVIVAEDSGGVRSYPQGSTYGHVAGYSAGGSSAGIESTRSSDLLPLDDGSITSWLITLFGGSVEPPEVRLTIVDQIQSVAAESLNGHTGAIVAIDPATGAVLAYASSPTTDPNQLVSGEVDIAEFLSTAASLDRVAFRLLPSGSTFKVLVAAAALEQGMTPDTVFEDTATYLAPGAGQEISNAIAGTCTGGDEITLREALAVSCNTLFARLAVDLGGDVINEIAERAGFNSILQFELGAAVSSIPAGADLEADPGALAQTGLGERDIRVTPLQMALMTAALGNDGILMRPYPVAAVLTRDGTTLHSTGAEQIGQWIDPAIAAEVVSMMVDVVTAGTGRAAAQPGVTVAGKTGTAEGADGPHSWFVALAPAEAPTIALAVVIEGEGTGGTVAAPIAARILEAWLR